MDRSKAVEITNVLCRLEETEMFRDEFNAFYENLDLIISDTLLDNILMLIDAEIHKLEDELDSL